MSQTTRFVLGVVVRAGIAGLLLTLLPQTASAQWTVAAYPVMGWLPLFGAGVDLPSEPTIPGDPGASVTIDSSFDSAWLAGLAVQSNRFMAEGSFLWAGLSGTLERPRVTLHSDIIYGEAFGGPRFGDFAIVGGVRRLALKFAAEVEGRPDFERKPGVWDPLVGADYRKQAGDWSVQGTFLE